MEGQASGVMGWIKRHATWVAGGIIGLIVAWYLLLRPQSSSGNQAPTSISFPASTTPTDTTSPTPATTPPNTVALSLASLGQSWHILGVSTGAPWSFSVWETGILQNLPAGINPSQGVMAYIWNTIYASPTLSQGGQAAIDFMNATLNDWLVNPGKYPSTGTPVLPPVPAPIVQPPPPPPTPKDVSHALPIMNPLPLSPLHVTGTNNHWSVG